MPRLDGLAACRVLHSHPRTHFIPVVIVTAASHLLREHADTIAYAAAAVLPKPFDLDALLATVATYVPPVRP